MVACCKPQPCDKKLLQILGEEGSRLLNDDYERIFDYFRNNHMRLDRQFISNRHRGRGGDDEPSDNRSSTTSAPGDKANTAPDPPGLSTSTGRHPSDTGARDAAGAGSAAGTGSTAVAAAQASGNGKSPLWKRDPEPSSPASVRRT
mmetsp:Transcript_49719/g.128320  ORF Transcript_49719/g.128320 Transcript_49719/m.128320 type:complete len:146 (+) Transcript_49719:254-691(+)